MIQKHFLLHLAVYNGPGPTDDCSTKLRQLDSLIEEGWTVAKTYVLDNAVLFSLTLAEEGDVVEEKRGEFGDVTDVQSVDFGQVEEMVKKGYVVQAIYAKNTIMLKRSKIQEIKKEDEETLEKQSKRLRDELKGFLNEEEKKVE